MKYKILLTIFCFAYLAFKSVPSFGQLTGIKTIPGDYSSISSAVAALNVATVGAGGVTFNVAANYTETISATIAVTATGTAANPIVFQKDPASTGANPLITAYTGGVGTPSTAVQDGIWRLMGSDYVTISGIDIRDNPSNTTNPSTMEYGYALYKANASNGCQFVTIQNCTITLNNINNASPGNPMTEGSAGIIVMNAAALTATVVLAPTVAAGSNSNNKFYGNTIQNCNYGISMIGYSAASPYTLADTNNDIGGNSAATGNTIVNFGGASGATNQAAAIRTLAQYGFNVSYNIINNNNGSGTNHSTTLRGIFLSTATSASANITNNTITLKGGGTTQDVKCIENTAGSTPLGNTINISNNLIINGTYSSATSGGFFGIYNAASPATLIISNNTISNNSSAAMTGILYGIHNVGTASTVAINGNTVSDNIAGASTGAFMAIINTAATPVLNINSNTIAGNATSTLSGLFYAIYNSGVVTTTININSNNIGTAISPAINFTAANSSTQNIVYNSKGGSAAALSINNNNFYNVLYSAQGTGSNYYILNIATTRSQAINNNIFTSLSVNTTGSIIFISNSVIVPANGTQNVNGNSIAGTFTKTGIGGSVILFTSSAASASGSVINNNNNNFSNINVSGATIIAGWVNTDAGASSKTIQNNTFSNWAGGTGAITAMSVNLTGVNNTTTGNTISSISGAGNITGITTGAGNNNIYLNTIHTLISSGSGSTIITGINVSAGTTNNIYRNTIYNLQGNNISNGTVRAINVGAGTTINVYQNTIYSLLSSSITSGSINGIVVFGGSVNAYQNTIYTLQGNALVNGSVNGLQITGGVAFLAYRNKIYDLSSSSSAITSGTVCGIQVSGSTGTANLVTTLRNNTIGDLRTPFANTTGDAIRGINLNFSGANSRANVYYNTVYLNSVSTGTNFGSTGIYHLGSATASTATLDLRNNIIYNNSVPNGTGLAVAFRKAGTSLANYTATSNNNLFYAGLPAANRLIFNDGTNADQLLSAYKARVATRDAQSVTEDMISTSKFLSTTGSSASFLHIDPSKVTQAESGAVNISGITTDFDGTIRQGNTGYAGTGTSPDIGADEVDATASPALSGSVNVGTGQTFTSLTNAGGLFAGINSRGLSGNLVVNITSDLAGEDGTNVLYQWAEQGVGNCTLLIKPDVSTARLISGNVLAGMIRFSGTKRVTIDGSNGTTTNYLTFRNTNTPATTGTAFTFINGATNNTIKYCGIEAYANATNGVILFSTSTVAGGNSNNSISNCSIGAAVASNAGNLCIYSAGTIGRENTTNTISNNTIFNYSDRGLDITATGSTGWTISGNSFYNGSVTASLNYAAGSILHGIRILGGTGYQVTNNYLGGNAALAGGTSASYSSTLGNVSYQGIVLTTSGASPASNIKGNTIANITVSSVPSAGGFIAFSGIETAGSGINIGGALPGDGNMIGSNTANSSIVVNTTTGTNTFTTTIRGISCASTGGLIIGNQAGGIDIKNIGAAPAPSAFTGIYINNATPPSQVNNNIIGSTGTGAASNSIQVLSSSLATTTAITGIALTSTVTSAVQVDGNTIQNLSHLSTASTVSAGGIVGISNASSGASAITITNNTITLLSTSANNSGLFYGIYNFGVCSSISINSNTINGNTTASATGAYFAIYNSGAVNNSININSNNIGNATTGAFTFTAANSGTHNFINNTAGAATAALSISNNNFQGITYSTAGSGSNFYIVNGAATLSQAINGNTFTSLNVNTTGSIIFISNNVAVPATGTQNVNNNSIVTSFNKTGVGNTVTLFTSTANSVAGSVINNNSNNFSNITVNGSTIIAGWFNTDAGASNKTIQNNTFSNWVAGTGQVNGMNINLTGTNNAITGNAINNISGAGIITGITTAIGNNNIYSNTINTLSTTGAVAVTGILVSSGTNVNIYKNKIYDLLANNAGATAYGISVSVSGPVAIANIYNNTIGDLRNPVANTSNDVLRGISLTTAGVNSTLNVYYNTIYLNATSTGATFSTSGIYHTTSASSTTATLNLRNNSITNTSTAMGTGITAAYRRSDATLTNYAATSNNNLFYAGTPGPKNLIFYGGTISDQTIATYKTRLSPADALSVTEDVTAKFLSTAGSAALFLHMNSTLTTLIESGAANITGFTDDFDGQTRAGNPGYTGSSSSPDIGADEIFGTETVPPTITYTPLSNTTSTANQPVTGVVITDASGVNIAAGTKPRIYYKRFSAANILLDNNSSSNGWKYTEATNSTSPFTFTIDYSLLFGGSTVTAGAIQYFIVAQDIATTANIGINSGTFAATPTSVALTAAAFPITGTINSYTIPFSGTYNVGAGEVFTSLTKANGIFAAINSAGLGSNTTFNIVSDLAEDGANALNQWTESGIGNYTLTILPNGPTVRTISGNVTAGLIRLDGADRVMINGSNGGSGSYLAFKNTSTSGTTGTAFTFINGTSNNTIKFCDLKAYANATNGVILFGGSAVAGGNSNNLIDNCTISATVASNTGNVAIYSAGTAGNENSTNIISNNTISNYRDRALDIGATGSTGWVISANSFYNGAVTGPINYAAATALHGIRILGGSGYSILNNYIGGTAALASGSNAVYASTSGNISYQGILLTTGGASPASNIKGNTVAGISLSSVPTAPGSTAFTGIETNGAGINIGGSIAGEGNQVGAAGSNGSVIITTSTTSTTNTSLITGINCASTGGAIIGNQVGGFDINNLGTAPASSSFTGLNINTSSAPSPVSNNTIGSNAISNSIRVLSSSSATTTALTGVAFSSSVNSNVLLNGNMIGNIGQLSLTSSGNFTGINNAAASGILTITNDTIQNIISAANANSGSTAYNGISSGGASSISNNIIGNIALNSSGPNAQVTGIIVSGAFAHTITGNFISGLTTASAKTSAGVETGSPSASAITGILNAATVAGQSIANNTLYNFNATNTSAVNTVVTGIGITATVSGNIFNNRIAGLTNKSTGTNPGICGVMAANGQFNLYNNSVKIDNSFNVNGVKMYGIVHAAGNNWNYYFNTVSIAGNATGTALRSAAFIRPIDGSLFLRDNIFVNTRTGTGVNYAISNLVSPASSTWPSSASNYNNLFSSNVNTIGEWGLSTNKTFAQWQSAVGGEANSVSKPASFTASLYDLQPDSASNCAINNAGTPVTSPVLINSDINAISRNAVSPDMGAYEFNYSVFTILAASNSPVCAGDSIDLIVNPGTAISPTFSWSNPANTVISTLQNPTVAAIAGQYKISVTDLNGCVVTDSVLASVNLRPTARMASLTSLCDSGLVNLTLTVTGTGTINGILSSGDGFSGTAPTIIVPVYVSSTTSYSISSLTDATCTSTITDLPDTVTITVTHKGDWLGITTDWSDPLNWCGGVLPTSTTDVTIPAGTPKMPIISTSITCNNLLINTGDTLTITNAGTLNVAGIITNNGIYADNGTTNFNGTTGQQTFSGITNFNNLTLNNTSGLLLPVAITVNKDLLISVGTLNANSFAISIKGNWTNNMSTTAFTAGTGIVTFNGTTAQFIGGSFTTSFNNLTIAATASTVTLNVNTSISGDLSVSSGILDLAGFTANRTIAGGILTVSNNATLKIGGTNTYPTNYTTNTLVVASTVEYSGTNQTVGNQVYGNLKLSSSGGAAVKVFPATALNIVGNLSSVLGAGTSVSFTAASNITINGNVSIGASTTFNGGSYSHSIGGNWTNSGTFNGNTGTMIFTGSGTLVSGTGAQNFNNLTVAASLVSFSNGSITLTGNLATTGSGSFSQASGGTLTMSGTGATISGAGISLDNLTVTGSVTTSTSLNLTGNLAVSGSFIASTGTITMSGTSKTISGAGPIGFSQLYATGSTTTNANFALSSGLTVSGSFSASAGTATFTGTSTLGGTANLYNIAVNGTSLQLSSGSVLGVANILSINSGVLNLTSPGNNTVNFNGTGAQNVNGITYSNLILSNGGTKTATGAITTANDITIGTGTILIPSAYTHSIYGNWTNNGTFNAGTSTIQFSGPFTAYITGATTFNILTSNTSTSSTELILQSNVSAATVNMINGVIQTGSNTLTITNTRTGTGYIYGNIQRIHAFTTGVAYAFEGPDNTITFSAVSAVTSVTVSVVQGPVNDFPFGSSISRVYNIAVPAGTYNATLRLHYEDNELNGNNESSMGLWNYNGSAWGSVGKTANSTASNYVEQSGLTNITNRWTCAASSNLVQWNGSVSTNWNTAANWTVLQGSGSTPPSAADIVDLGSATFNNQPVITNTVTVKNIIFGSAKAVILTLGSGGTLTTLGNINGNWAGNATHTINVNDQTLTANGNIYLSDGVNGHAININIGLGTVTTLNSLSESGGANINFSGAGTLNIFTDFSYSSGTFTAGSGTVTYNGDQNQDVASINYNNLTINKTGGLAEINNTVNIGGNLLISSGELGNFSTTSINGNVTINTGDTLQNYHILHVKGNWNNNGFYIPTGASIFFDGSGTQTISASTFNNLNINKPVGSTAVLTGDIIINGDLTITSGTLDIKTFNCNRNVQGGTLTLGDSATFIIGANNSPLNFSNGNLSNSSTVIANGTGPQFIFGVDFGNLIFRNAGAKTLVSPITVNGDLTIESGSNFDAGSQTLTLNGNWINSGSFTPSTSTIICSGTGKTVTGNTTFNKATITGSYTNISNITYNDLLQITSTGSLSGGATIFTTLNGDLINNGILYTLGTTTFTGNVLQTLSLINAVNTVAITVNFNGTVSPVLNSTSAPQYGFLNINNTGGINPSVGWNILYALTVGSGASFNGGISTHNILGSVTNNGTITSSGILNVIPASPATVNLGSNFSSTGRVVFGGAGAITMAGAPASMHDVVISNTNGAGITPSSNWNITNNITVNSGSILNAGNYSYLVGGKISNSGTISSGSSTFILNGTGTQDMYTLSPFNNLTLNKATGISTLSSDATVSGILNFVKGSIQTGAYTLTLPLSGTVTGAAQSTGWVNGNFQKSVASGTNVSRIFEVGGINNYNPATLLFANVSVDGNLTGSAISTEHPQIDFSGIDKTQDVNTYWTFINTGISFTTANATFNWQAADMDAGANTTNFKPGLYNGTAWVFPAFAAPLPTSIQATGLTSLESFAIGERTRFATWTGAGGTADWFTPANWSGGVPGTTIETLIPTTLQAGRAFPVINAGTAAVDTLTIQNAATITVTNATLQIKGAIINNGTFDVSAGTIEMNGSSPQTIPAGAFSNNSIQNLVINNDVTLAGQDTLTGTLTMGSANKTFATGGFLNLKSTATATARVTALPVDVDGAATSSITGNVTVERYIPAKRSWRLLTAPLSNTGNIYNSWQNGGNYQVGRGMFVSGPAPSTANGLDASALNNPSMKIFNEATQAFVNITDTKNTNLSNSSGTADNVAYFTFVRGDRNPNNLTTAFASFTTLRSAGALQTGKQIFAASGTYNSYTMVGNPYASPVDFNNVQRNHLIKRIYTWDPSLNLVGGYVALDDISGTGNFSTSNPSSLMNQYIQPGQAFFVQTDTATNASLIFYESSKNDSSRNIGFRPMAPIKSMDLTLSLLAADQSTIVADAAVAEFDDRFCACINLQDAVKFGNVNETFSLIKKGVTLAIEREPEINSNDTLFLNLTHSSKRSYQLMVVANNLAQPSLVGSLEDSYLASATSLNLDGTTLVNFTINGDPASGLANRFRVVFKQSTVLPVTYSNVQAWQAGSNIAVQWTVQNQLNILQYEVEKSTDGIHFTKVNTQPVTSGGATVGIYKWMDLNTVKGDNFYRIRNVDLGGTVAYSKVVKVNMENGNSGIVVYPNPLTGGVISLQLQNMAAGQYNIRLLNSIGQAILIKDFKHTGGSAIEKIQLAKYIAKGIYKLEVTNSDMSKTDINVVIQ